MKKYYLLTALIVLLGAISLKLNAQNQTAQTVIAAAEPRGLAFYGNDLYIAEYAGGKIFKIDATVTPAVRTEVFSIANPYDITVHNNVLYVMSQTGTSSNKSSVISKIDLTTKVKTELLTTTNSLHGLAVHKDELYYIDYSDEKILKINLATLAKTEFYTGAGAGAKGFVFSEDGKYLYLASFTAIARVDVNSPSTVAVMVEVTPKGTSTRSYDRPDKLSINGSELYSLQYVDAAIYKINTNGTSPFTKTELIQMATRTQLPSYIVYRNKALYIAEGRANKISKIGLDCDFGVTKQGNTLTAKEAGGTYQWVDCNNSNKPIQGATSQSYTATTNGSYAVRNTSSSCTGTSACTEINTLGLIENTFATKVKIYPNPISDKLTIELGKEYSNLTVEITNILGQVILSQKVSTTNNKVVLPLAASAGIYFVRVAAKEGFASFKVIKE